ncbi:MAG: hypothetical protein PHT88_05200, partial [Candidatus Moranbacteria bacterium]|nr:hypothetical protein [Candidatus Moranbacteria bacterium]
MTDPQAKMSYLKDGEIYGLWKYLNGFRLVERSLLKFDDVIPSDQSNFFIAKFLGILQIIGVKKLNGLVFHKDIYLQYHGTLYENLQKAKATDTSSFGAKALEYLECIIKGDIERFYRNDTGIFDLVFYEKIIQIAEFFEFSIDLLPQDKQQLGEFVTLYIENFIDNNLKKNKE